ncbi:unnamed protein product [Closterium sp. Naga37s-1]|nr:unnamed protein product [Closterium sp. Naga37s-1]
MGFYNVIAFRPCLTCPSHFPATNTTPLSLPSTPGGAEPLLPPPSPPPPPSPVSKGASHSLSPVPAALSAALVLVTSTALLALTLL